jgi:hypothetical protein
MSYPALVVYAEESEYQHHFERMYCRGPVVTFDGIPIRFQKRNFPHAFFESNRKKDDTFSRKRAERIDWIKAALQDPESERYIGWDNKKKRHDGSRRVTVVMGNYVVVIGLNKQRNKGRFITAYVADSGRTIGKIRSGPQWT